jgi:hypothetical protein
MGGVVLQPKGVAERLGARSAAQLMQASLSLLMDEAGGSAVHAIVPEGPVVRCCEVFPADPALDATLARVRALPRPFQRVLEVERRGATTVITLERFVGVDGEEVISRLREVDRLLPLPVWSAIARAWLDAAHDQPVGLSAPTNLGFAIDGQLVLSADRHNFAIGRLRPLPNHPIIGRGLPRSLSPEDARGQPLTPASRVYSLGLSLIRLLTLEPIFADQPVQHLQQVISGRTSWTARRHPDATPGLAAVLARSIAREPGERFESPRALLAALEPELPPSAAMAPCIAGLCEPGFRSIVVGLLRAPEFLPRVWTQGGLRVMEDRLLEHAVPVDELPRPTCPPAPPMPPLVALPSK